MNNRKTSHDVIVIGAGPAGCAAATLLADAGRRVLVLEREKFPRYHIGESMLPFTYHPLQRLGLIDRMRQSQFVKKHSVQFVAPAGQASQPFYFASRYDENVAQTWQVVRSEFDQMLMERARDRGAEIRERIQVTELLRDGDRILGVMTEDADGHPETFTAPMTLDCTGKESFAAVRNRWRIRDPKLNKVAVWTYYQGSKRDGGVDAGATTVAFIPQNGWFWYIPQHEDRVSVGVVAEGKYLNRDGVKDLRAIFEREVEQNLWIKEYLSHGTQTGPYYITNEYSFHSRHCACEGLLLVGDAFCFLDPVFSSGLMFALKSGVMAADAVNACFEANDFSPARFADYGMTLREGIENMRRLVYAFYDPHFSFRKLTNKYPDLVGDITDCLSGDVNKDFSHLFKAVAEFAEVPDPLPYGEPLVSGRQEAARG